MIRKFICLLLLLLPTLGQASQVWVRDSAGVLGESNRQYLETLMQTVQTQTTAEVMIITVPSLEGQDVDSFATRMFNQIGIGQRDTNNGVLFLIAPNERRTRIEVGYGLEPLLTDARAGSILDNEVIPHFRRNDMEGGIVAGAVAIADLLQRYPDAARGVAGSAPLYVRDQQSDFRLALWLVAGCALVMFALYFWIRRTKRFPALLLYGVVAVAIAIVVLAVAAYVGLRNQADLPLPQAILSGLALLAGLFFNQRLFRRYGPHTCEYCSGPMELLSETADDQHLNQVQRLEEKLGSVDYDVWHCPACLKTDTERYVAMFSSFKACPKCKAQTLKETRTTLVAATRSHGGKVRIDGKCYSCAHTTSRVEHTPRISSSSGSSGGSGGSSGGGSSGGGGASRSW